MSDQPYEHPILLNPALTGAGSHIRVGTFYRNQWLNVKSPFNAYGAVYDMHFGLYDNHNLGFSVVNDVQGAHVIQHMEFFVYYAYMLDVTYNFRLRFGLQAGGILKMANYNRLIFPDMLGNPNARPPNYESLTSFSPDIGLGVAGDIEGWNFGLSILHLVEPAYDIRRAEYLKTPRRYTIHGYKEFNVYELYRFQPPLFLSPHVLIQWGESLFKRGDKDLDITAGFMAEYRGMKGAIWLRSGVLANAWNVAVQVGWTGYNFALAYTYGIGLMSEGFYGLNSSTHELSLSLYMHRARVSHLRNTFSKRGRYTRYSRTRTGAMRSRKKYTRRYR